MEFFSHISESSATDFKSVFENSKVVHYTPAGIETAQLAAFYTSKAAELGIPLIYEEDPVTGEIRVNHWTEIKYISGKETDSYKHSNKYQPLHTDYGYFAFEIYTSFFYCVEQADFGGATTFIDVDRVVSILERIDPALLHALQETKISFGRKDNPLTNNQDFILSRDTLGWKINWNYYRALNDAVNHELVQTFRHFLDDHIEKSGELMSLRLQPGEAVFFQDRRVLHGRNSFLGARQLNKGGIAKEVPVQIINLLRQNDGK